MAAAKWVGGRPFVSAMTLALFEDSGWYVADYAASSAAVSGVDFGYGAGCAAVTGPCVAGQECPKLVQLFNTNIVELKKLGK